MPQWKTKNKNTDQYTREHRTSKPFGETSTRTAGVMTMRQQIDRLRAAQIVQGAWKRKHFPADAQIPDDFWPPGYGMDEADALDAAKLVLRGISKGQARKMVAERPPKPTPDPAPGEPGLASPGNQ